jgi:predicted nuclease of predicted toxin-antitoxin system
VKFFANENIPVASVKKLRQNGFEVISVFEECPGETDLKILKKAFLERLIIITFDRDYGELIYKNRQLPPAGVIYLRFTPSHPEYAADMLLRLFNSNIQITGKFTVLETDKVRQRDL